MVSIPKVAPNAAPSLLQSTYPSASPPPLAPSRAAFPVAACGPLLEAAVDAVAARTQAPCELIAHHLLTLAAMVAQRLVGVRLPTGEVQPLSCYFLTLADSGEGRGAAEAMCIGPVRFWQRRFSALWGMGTALNGWRAALAGADAGTGTCVAAVPLPAPDPHAMPPLSCFKHDRAFLSPERAGLSERNDRYAHFVRRSGLFASLAADLLTPSAARGSEARSLRALWDGSSAAAGAERTDTAPRLSVHLVTGLREGLAFLRSAEVADSGLLARLLVAQPASRIGVRTFSESDGAPPPALQAFHARLTGLYAREATCGARVVALDEQARALWLSFTHEMEAAIAPGGTFAAIRPPCSPAASNSRGSTPAKPCACRAGRAPRRPKPTPSRRSSPGLSANIQAASCPCARSIASGRRRCARQSPPSTPCAISNCSASSSPWRSRPGGAGGCWPGEARICSSIVQHECSMARFRSKILFPLRYSPFSACSMQHDEHYKPARRRRPESR